MLTCLGFASIETIRPGDYVYSRDMQTGAIEEQAVLDVYEREVYETYSITIGDEEIEATAEHPFYTPDDGWVAAEDLEVGDEVATADGESETVDDIVRNILDEPVTVYNFAVMDNHNYFVGENKLLVHNMCAKNPTVAESKFEKAIEKHADKVKEKTTRRQAFRQAKEATGIPKSAQYKRHKFVYDGTTENRIVYEFEVNGETKYIIEHPFDKNGRGKHFHGADDAYGSPYNKGTYNQYDGHFPEDIDGFE